MAEKSKPPASVVQVEEVDDEDDDDKRYDWIAKKVYNKIVI
jgi:hypothetical protein